MMKGEAADKMEEAFRRYINSPKGKEALRRYQSSEKGKQARKRYFKSEKGKTALLRYYLSEKGVKARQKRIQMRKLLEECNRYLQENPTKTPLDFLSMVKEKTDG
jgi:phage anti-repressor protein